VINENAWASARCAVPKLRARLRTPSSGTPL